jgi:hypothetical protein
MRDDRDALLVVGDAEAVGLVAFDAELLLVEHADLVDRVHVRDQHDLLGAGALEGRAHDLAELFGRVFHLVDVGGARLDEFDLAAERLELAGDEVGDLVEPLGVAAARFDRHQLLERFEQRGFFLGGERGDARIGRRRGGGAGGAKNGKRNGVAGK